jgi:hypothetical protein
MAGFWMLRRVVITEDSKLHTRRCEILKFDHYLHILEEEIHNTFKL